MSSLTRRRLYDLVWTRPISVLAGELGISASGLSKICDRMLVPCPPRGHWAKARSGQSPERPPLPPAPKGAPDRIVISGERAPSRRRRTRLPPDERRQQLIDAAAALIAAEGLPALTMKAVARQVGVSEAQAHNHFPQARDLLLALARRELAAMEENRVAELSRGADRLERVTLSTVTYLREVAERGALIQVLTNSNEVRDALRQERNRTRRTGATRVADDLAETYGVAPALAYGATVILTALTRRAGRLVAERKLPLDAAERLTMTLVTAGNRELARGGR